MRAPSSRRAALGLHKIGRVGLASLVPAFGTLLLAGGLGSSGAEAKTPGKTYCFYSKCHRVKTIAETEALIGADETVSASHYDSCKRDRYNPCGLTSSGAVFDSEAADNAASPIYPDGTTLLVWSPETRASLVLRVNNAGPYWGNRKLDVSRKSAEVLGFAGEGVATLRVRVIDAPSVQEATYRKNRKYDPVPGYIGVFANLDEAQTGAQTAYMVAGLPSPFGQTTVALGAGNPTQAAGATGTQSGATPPLALVPRTVLAAAEITPSELISPVASPVVASVTAREQVAGFVAMVESADVPRDARPARVASRGVQLASADADAFVFVRKRARAEQAAGRNSRSFRKAAKTHKIQQKQKTQKKQQNKPDRQIARAVRSKKPIAVAVAKVPQGKRLMQDGTNDPSIFSRHVYAGVERLASQEPQRRRPARVAAGRHAARDEG